MQKLIIHPGFHKTGTTALQQSLSEARLALEEVNFYYPHTAGHAHHRAAWAIIEKTWGWKKRGGRVIAPIEWQKLERKIKNSKKTSIISSEFFSEANEDQLANLKSRLNEFEVQVIFTWRPLPFMLASSYQQYLKYGVKLTYAQWLESIFEKPGEAKLTPSFWKRNLHGEVITAWAQTFGTENISVIAVDESQPAFLYSTFAELAGIPVGILKSPVHKEVNRSLTFTEAELLLEINLKYPKENSWDSYEVFIRKGNIKALSGSEEFDKNDEKILTPQWAIDKAALMNSSCTTQIKSLGVKIIGDIDRSDYSRIPVGVNKPVTNISIETAARAMIGVNLDSIKSMHGKTISDEFFVRLRQTLKRKFKFPR